MTKEATERIANCRTWRFCASVAEAHKLVQRAQERGFGVELTSLRDGRDPHAACAKSLHSTGGGGIDGYELFVSCDPSPDFVAKVWPVIAPAARGCIAFLA